MRKRAKDVAAEIANTERLIELHASVLERSREYPESNHKRVMLEQGSLYIADLERQLAFQKSELRHAA